MNGAGGHITYIMDESTVDLFLHAKVLNKKVVQIFFLIPITGETEIVVPRILPEVSSAPN